MTGPSPSLNLDISDTPLSPIIEKDDEKENDCQFIISDLTSRVLANKPANMITQSSKWDETESTTSDDSSLQSGSNPIAHEHKTKQRSKNKNKKKMSNKRDAPHSHHEQQQIPGIELSRAIHTGSRFIKAPYRASLLTRILRECFIVGGDHRTAIIASVSPTPTDLEHTINTLEHICMMDIHLQDLCSMSCVDLTITEVSSAVYRDTPVFDWTPQQVKAWLSCAEGGRFSHLPLPPGVDGRTMLGLQAASLSQMFAGELRQARQEGEGGAWVEEVETNRRQIAIGNSLWKALRREQQAFVQRRKQAARNDLG
jgi:hypothetical protein